MMKNYDAAFKAKMVLEAVRGEKIVAQMPIPTKPTVCSGDSDHLTERSDAGRKHPNLTGRFESSLTAFFS